MNIKIISIKEAKLREHKFKRSVLDEENKLIAKLPENYKKDYVAKLNNR